MAGTSNIFRSDYYELYNVVQGSFLSYPKQLTIEIFREVFKNDSYYHFTADEWGFPKVPSLKGKKSTAGYNDDESTRIFIGEFFKRDMIFYPSVLIKSSSSKSVPLSFSRNRGVLMYQPMIVTDGYKSITKSVPDYISMAGWYEGVIDVQISAGSVVERDQIAEVITNIITITHYDTFKNAGMTIYDNSTGSFQETDDGSDKIYKCTVNFSYRVEWEKRIKVDSVVNAITFCIDFANLENPNPVVAQNLSVHTLLQFIEDL